MPIGYFYFDILLPRQYSYHQKHLSLLKHSLKYRRHTSHLNRELWKSNEVSMKRKTTNNVCRIQNNHAYYRVKFTTFQPPLPPHPYGLHDEKLANFLATHAIKSIIYPRTKCRSNFSDVGRGTWTIWWIFIFLFKSLPSSSGCFFGSNHRDNFRIWHTIFGYRNHGRGLRSEFDESRFLFSRICASIWQDEKIKLSTGISASRVDYFFFYPSRIYTMDVHRNGTVELWKNYTKKGCQRKGVCRRGGNLLNLHVHTRNVK